MSGHERPEQRATVDGWWVTIGGPSADIHCPHGEAVEYLNHRDYELSNSEQTYEITAIDLADWLIANSDWLAEYCVGHTRHR